MRYTKVAVLPLSGLDVRECRLTGLYPGRPRLPVYIIFRIAGFRGRSRRSSNRPSHHDVIFVTCNLVGQKRCRIKSKSIGPNVRTR